MKKLLKRLESLVDLKLIEVRKSEGIFGLSQVYDYSVAQDTSNSYDESGYYDFSSNNDPFV